MISRAHAFIEIKEEKNGKISLQVVDNNSLNGIYVNNIKVKQQVLENNDLVTFGGAGSVSFGEKNLQNQSIFVYKFSQIPKTPEKQFTTISDYSNVTTPIVTDSKKRSPSPVESEKKEHEQKKEGKTSSGQTKSRSSGTKAKERNSQTKTVSQEKEGNMKSTPPSVTVVKVTEAEKKREDAPKKKRRNDREVQMNSESKEMKERSVSSPPKTCFKSAKRKSDDIEESERELKSENSLSPKKKRKESLRKSSPSKSPSKSPPNQQPDATKTGNFARLDITEENQVNFVVTEYSRVMRNSQGSPSNSFLLEKISNLTNIVSDVKSKTDQILLLQNPDELSKAADVIKYKEKERLLLARIVTSLFSLTFFL